MSSRPQLLLSIRKRLGAFLCIVVGGSCTAAQIASSARPGGIASLRACSNAVAPQGTVLTRTQEREYPAIKASMESISTRGSILYIKLDAYPRSQFAAIGVRVSYKTNTDFHPVCESVFNTWPVTTNKNFIQVARDDGQARYTTWIIEINPQLGTHRKRPKHIAVDMEIYEEVNRESQADERDDGLRTFEQNQSKYTCASRAVQSGSSSEVKTDFGKNTVLDVAVFDKGQLLKTEAARLDFSRAILQSIALWTASCQGCAPGNNAIVSVQFVSGGRDYIFVDNNLRSSLRLVADQPRPPDAMESIMSGVVGNSMRLGHDRKISYEPFFPKERQYQLLCDVHFKDLPEALRELALEACGYRVERDSVPKRTAVVLEILNGHTSCGGDGIIGCGISSDRVEIDGSDYAYEFYGSHLFGGGIKNVDLLTVLIHEVGHWVGLPHLPGEHSIMGSRYGNIRCIDDVVIEEMQRVTSNGPLNVGDSLGLSYQ